MTPAATRFEPASANLPIRLATLGKRPLVSVLVTNYNYGHLIGQAIAGLRAQSYPYWEAIICDDGSRDNSVETIKALTGDEPRFTLVEKNNGGQASAINAAWQRSRGEIICLLDADDIFFPAKVEKIVRAFRRSNAGIVAHQVECVQFSSGSRSVIKKQIIPAAGYIGREHYRLWRENVLPPPCGTAFRREVMERILPLPEDRFRSTADGPINALAALISTLEPVHEVLATYRIHGNNLTGTTLAADFLDGQSLRKGLALMENTTGYVDEVLRRDFGMPMPEDNSRQYREHRLAVAILGGDRMEIGSAAAALRRAFRIARSDYPLHRFVFWQAISLLPHGPACAVLQTAFRGFRKNLRARATRPARKVARD